MRVLRIVTTSLVSMKGHHARGLPLRALFDVAADLRGLEAQRGTEANAWERAEFGVLVDPLSRHREEASDVSDSPQRFEIWRHAITSGSL